MKSMNMFVKNILTRGLNLLIGDIFILLAEDVNIVVSKSQDLQEEKIYLSTMEKNLPKAKDLSI